MALPTEPLDCIAFILIANHCVLVEKRSEQKRLLPGVLAIPGGHVDEGESIEAALVRELHEELNVARAIFHISACCSTMPRKFGTFTILPSGNEMARVSR